MTAQQMIEILSKLDPDTEIIVRDRHGAYNGMDLGDVLAWSKVVRTYPKYFVIMNTHPITTKDGKIEYH